MVLWDLIFGQNNVAGRTSIGAKCMASSWSFTWRLTLFQHCFVQFYVALNFDKRSYHSFSTCWICVYTCKTPLSIISRWNKKHDVGFSQPPDKSRSHLYRGTIPSTPTTAIYREYTVPDFGINWLQNQVTRQAQFWPDPYFNEKNCAWVFFLALGTIRFANYTFFKTTLRTTRDLH